MSANQYKPLSTAILVDDQQNDYSRFSQVNVVGGPGHAAGLNSNFVNKKPLENGGEVLKARDKAKGTYPSISHGQITTHHQSLLNK